jgi:hypothetical protein
VLSLLVVAGGSLAAEVAPPAGPRGKPIRPPVMEGVGLMSTGTVVRLPGGVVITNLPPEVLPKSPTNVVRLPAAAARRFEPLGYQPVNFTLLARFFLTVPETGSDAEKWAAVRAQIPDDVKAMEGQKVAIAGFMLPVTLENGRSREFLLLRTQSACCFGMVPRVNELIIVKMPAPGMAPKVDVPVVVGGRMRLKWIGDGGQLTAIYEMEGERAERVESR